MGSFNYTYLIIGIIVALIIFYLFLYDYFFATKIYFNTTEFENYNLNDEIRWYKRLSINLSDEKIIRTLFYGRIMLENTSAELLTKLVLPEGWIITIEAVKKAKKIFKKYKNYSFENAEIDVKICYMLFYSFLCERTGDKTTISLSNQYDDLFNRNKELLQEIANSCSSMFTEECFKELTEKKLISTVNSKFSSVEINALRIGILIYIIGLEELDNTNHNNYSFNFQ